MISAHRPAVFRSHRSLPYSAGVEDCQGNRPSRRLQSRHHVHHRSGSRWWRLAVLSVSQPWFHSKYFISPGLLRTLPEPLGQTQRDCNPRVLRAGIPYGGSTGSSGWTAAASQHLGSQLSSSQGQTPCCSAGSAFWARIFKAIDFSKKMCVGPACPGDAP